MKTTTQIQKIRAQLETLIESSAKQCPELKKEILKILDISSVFETNWIGSWASSTYNQYQNFISPEEGIIEPTFEQVRMYVENEAETNIDQISNRVSKILDANNSFKDEIVTELSIIKDKPNLTSEIELLDQIEKQKMGLSSMDYSKSKIPSSFPVNYRDANRVQNQGLLIPPHIRVDGELYSLLSKITSIESLHKNSKRLLRQLELKLSPTGIDKPDTSLKESFIYLLIDKFHLVVNQLKNRYDKRETIQIQDEYDVQDLFHSLLKINFDDVRPEEYTPSYAGSSTRVDFLLKNEKVIIEIKKTRKGLQDKQIGDQLILDVQHYKTHPDCKHLICFIYDPESKIINPRGLENDLNILSSDDLLVEAFVRP